MNIPKPHNFLAVLGIFLAVVLLENVVLPERTVQANGSQAQTGVINYLPFAASAPAAIYGDQLGSNWQDWSWDANRNFTNSTPTYSGSASISVSLTKAWGALYLHRTSPQSMSGYTHLEFYIHGGSAGGQRLKVIANSNTAKAYSVTAKANAWTKISIPLSSLGSPASLTDLWWQDASGAVLPKFYLDVVTLVNQGASATATPGGPTATATTRPSATATSSGGNYFGTLPPGSSLPSDATCASQVKQRAENKRMNATYNATRGNQQLASDFFGSADDPRANSQIAPRVDGNFTGTTDEILQWTACKWGIDEDMVRAQAAIESWWRQTAKGDWTTDASRCAPGHGLGVDGTAGQCPESFGVLQNRYPYEQSAWPGIYSSTAFNSDTAYAIWRACYEGYETWLNNVEHGQTYAAGDAWGCVGRWFAGRWHTQPADDYMNRVKDYLNQRIWTTAGFQEP
jgi:hypothetical protein